jgi:hypothetical protein
LVCTRTRACCRTTHIGSAYCARHGSTVEHPTTLCGKTHTTCTRRPARRGGIDGGQQWACCLTLCTHCAWHWNNTSWTGNTHNNQKLYQVVTTESSDGSTTTHGSAVGMPRRSTHDATGVSSNQSLHPAMLHMLEGCGTHSKMRHSCTHGTSSSDSKFRHNVPTFHRQKVMAGCHLGNTCTVNLAQDTCTTCSRLMPCKPHEHADKERYVAAVM